jgi:acetyltransferase-like isoleucine patch superfamily enzyme
MNSNHGPLCREVTGAMVASLGARAGMTNVRVELGAKLGIGARVAPWLRVGRCTMVGAGAVVIRDFAPGATVAGVPARELSCTPAAPGLKARPS